MGAVLDTGNKKSVNVHLNIVPFIDLMSCLTAFLLYTAVWSHMAQISIKPKGVGQDAITGESEEVRASVLIQKDQIWVGLSRINDFRRIPRQTTGSSGSDVRDDEAGTSDDGYDWQELGKVLAEHKQSAHFAGREDIEIAAEDEVSYQTIVSAMDVAVAAGFGDVGLADPNALSARPVF